LYLVIGATGNVGREVVAELLAVGERVRVFTRNAQKAERWAGKVEVALGDLGHAASVGRAADGVAGIFVMTSGEAPPVEALAAAIQKSGSPRVTFLSTLDAGEPHIRLERRHAAQEEAWRASGLPCAFVRPGAFMSNTFQWISTIKSQGVVYNPLGDAKVAPIAPRDIARVAVETLRRPDLTGQAFRLTGPDLLSAPDQVAILSRVLGKSLLCVEVPIQAAVDGMIRGGMPADFADILREMLEHIRTERVSVRTSEVERITSKKPLSFEAWALENRGAFV
jgi:uncharacterized protein YbjT (DUF2867 family)